MRSPRLTSSPIFLFQQWPQAVRDEKQESRYGCIQALGGKGMLETMVPQTTSPGPVSFHPL